MDPFDDHVTLPETSREEKTDARRVSRGNKGGGRLDEMVRPVTLPSVGLRKVETPFM